MLSISIPENEEKSIVQRDGVFVQHLCYHSAEPAEALDCSQTLCNCAVRTISITGGETMAALIDYPQRSFEMWSYTPSFAFEGCSANMLRQSTPSPLFCMGRNEA